MKLMIYNIAYGTGSPDAYYRHLFTGHRYLRTSKSHLDRIIDFIDDENPDVLGLIEVDMGSYRTRYVNQVETIANRLDHFHYSSVKYAAKSVGRKLPIMRMQGNAILTRQRMSGAQFHYFPVGFKRLIIELEFNGIHFFLVHLALHINIRMKQLEFLANLAAMHERVVIAGDFNISRDKREIIEFQRALNLLNANSRSLPTFPSWNPRRELDFVLHSRKIQVTSFRVPDVRYSDHLPLIVDFQIK